MKFTKDTLLKMWNSASKTNLMYALAGWVAHANYGKQIIGLVVKYLGGQ